jgi:Protein of unknown function (DUF3891)
VIVRREGEGWTLIRQMDHAAHCGEISRAWRSGPFGKDAVSASLEYAAGYHDLGWTETDREPELDSEGRPRNFTQVDETRHAKFYSGAVRTVAQTDPYAGYLVSLHASGLYGRRFGWNGFRPIDWTGIGEHGRQLVSDERAFRADLVSSLAPAEVEFDAAWRNYMLLETFDFVSLLSCFGLDSPGCGPVPTVPGQFEHLTVTRSGLWEVVLDPFPFEGDRLELEVTCVHLDAQRFESESELRDGFRDARPETRKTIYRAAGG